MANTRSSVRVSGSTTVAVLSGRGAQFLTSSLPRQTLYAVTVIIEWPEAGSGRRFVLQTERLGAAPEGAP